MKKRVKLGVVALSAVAGATLAPAAAAAPATTQVDPRITIGTHNTLRGAADYNNFAGIIGWQEVKGQQSQDKLRRQLPDNYRHYFAKGPNSAGSHQVPISWRHHRFEKLASGYQRTHPGEAGVTPARFVTWVKLKLRGTNKKVVVVNTHLISGAWSKHPERRERWYTHMRKLRSKVRTLHANHPNARLFVVGDFNRRKALPMPSPLKYTPIKGVRGVRLDHMYAPTDVQHSLALQRPKWGSDHHAYKMRVRL